MEQGIIRRLRVKFIAINMALAFLVLLVTFGTVCALNHVDSVNTINAHLTYVLTRAASSANNSAAQLESVKPLERPDVAKADISITKSFSEAASNPAITIDNLPTNAQSEKAPSDDAGADDASAGSPSSHDAADAAESAAFPAEPSEDESAPNVDDATEDAAESDAATDAQASVASDPPSSSAPSAASTGSVAAPVIGSGEASTTILTAVFKVEENGIYTTIPAYTTATLPESILLRADETVINSPSANGYLPEYDLMYEKLHTDGGWFVAYANASSTHIWQGLAMLLAMVGLIALLVFFLINILFSQWATRPVAMSIRRQQQFTADASHELKTPLTVILANLSILRSHADSTVAEQMQWVESSETEAHRMQLLVNDMLSLARPQTASMGTAPAPAENVDLSDLVEGEALQFESVAFERGIMLDSRIQEGVHVAGDPEKLGRMVSTLIDNACKYADDDGLVDVTLEVDASGTVSDPKALLRVHNSGEPIPPGELQHVFDRFYRADKARTGGKGGYGLGLAIGQQIAHEHNGEITVASSAGSGTTFTVTLPLSDE